MSDFSSCVCDFLTLKMRKGEADSAVLGIFSTICLYFALFAKKEDTSHVKFSLEPEYVLV